MTATHQRATAARITAAGRSAIAVVQVQAPAAHLALVIDHCFRAFNDKAWRDQGQRRMIYGRWGGESAEDVVLCQIADAALEIQCHGGEAAVSRILADLQSHGVEVVSSQSQLQSEGDVLHWELHVALSQAPTIRTANLLHHQLLGCLRKALEFLTRLPWSPRDCEAASVQISRLLHWAQFGLRLSQPWSVVLTGRPNTGKSSLINALLGFQRAIVSEQPGTTRDVVTGISAFDGWAVQLSDTAGLRATQDDLENAGMDRARQRLQQADLVIVVLDQSRPLTDDDRALVQQWPHAIIVANKSDLPSVWEEEIALDVAVSARTHQGIDHLQSRIVAALVPEVPPPETPIPITPRQVRILVELQQAIANNDEAAYRLWSARLLLPSF